MVLLLSCDKPWYQHCFPILNLCGGVRGGLLNPSLFAFPSKGLCEECGEFNWSLSVPVWLPAPLPAHVLGTADYLKLDTGWPPRRGKPGGTKIHSRKCLQRISSLTWGELEITGNTEGAYHSAHLGIHSRPYIEPSKTWNLLPGIFTWETQYGGSGSPAQ